MTDVERIAVLESQVKDLKDRVKSMETLLNTLAENAADRHDVQKRFVIVKNCIERLATPSQRSLFEQIFGF